MARPRLPRRGLAVGDSVRAGSPRHPRAAAAGLALARRSAAGAHTTPTARGRRRAALRRRARVCDRPGRGLGRGGRAHRARRRRRLDLSAGGTASVIGFAGEYCGYWVTPEEYDAQLYEGASTLYGREASVWLQDELVRLVRRAMDDAPDDDAESAAAPECAGVRPPRLAAAMAALLFCRDAAALPVAMSTAPWEADKSDVRTGARTRAWAAGRCLCARRGSMAAHRRSGRAAHGRVSMRERLGAATCSSATPPAARRAPACARTRRSARPRPRRARGLVAVVVAAPAAAHGRNRRAEMRRARRATARARCRGSRSATQRRAAAACRPRARTGARASGGGGVPRSQSTRAEPPRARPHRGAGPAGHLAGPACTPNRRRSRARRPSPCRAACSSGGTPSGRQGGARRTAAGARRRVGLVGRGRARAAARPPPPRRPAGGGPRPPARCARARRRAARRGGSNGSAVVSGVVASSRPAPCW